MTHQPIVPDRITLTRGSLATLLARHATLLADGYRTEAAVCLPGYRDGLHAAADKAARHATRLTAVEESTVVGELLDGMLTTPGSEQPELATHTPALTGSERALLRYALDAAQQQLPGWIAPDDPAFARLRRLADETQPTTETRPFVPPAHYRRDDGVDCCVHAIPVGPDSCDKCRELADDEAHAAEEQPAAGARQDGAQPTPHLCPHCGHNWHGTDRCEGGSISTITGCRCASAARQDGGRS
ncbi:hypothetical protein [Streptomyces sp. bgisy154]|uniref:hypothetical protein n=1 Tax=Streptomyces sp. bgisy154 TaxID=3413794 RepID=UPI003D76269F